MGLFNFFRKNQKLPKPVENQNELLPHNENQIEIFAEQKLPAAYSGHYPSNGEAKGIEAIYSFLQGDYESKGYNDALTSAEDSNKIDNMKLIQLDLEILIQKVDTYYKDSIREIDFHVNSRTRAGLIELVEELKTRKEMVLEHMQKVEEIKKEIQTKTGMTQRIILSYQRGFMRGLSAVTQSRIINKKM
jgi:hypothetical protein